jgi:hypothetical protein
MTTPDTPGTTDTTPGSIRCTALTLNGHPCRVLIPADGDPPLCRWHDPALRSRIRLEGQRGGLKSYPKTRPIAEMIDVSKLDLSTPAGWLALLSEAGRGLAKLPTDPKLTNALSIVAASARSIIESSDLARRIERLEEHQQQAAERNAVASRFVGGRRTL